MKTKQEKYNEKYPIVASYKGWVIRSFVMNHRFFGEITYYICNVKIGLESYQSSFINLIQEWIDEKIKEGKTQNEY